jgi:hypothetical protein
VTGERIALATLMVTGYLAVIAGFLVWSVRQHRAERRWDAWLAKLHADELRKRNPNREGTP